MRIHLLGVRGSTPTPGADFVRYGGDTSCIAVQRDDGSVGLVVDAGTGLRGLGPLLDGAPFRGTILLGHLHWDHTHGLPFCPAVDHPDAVVRVLAPSHDGSPVDQLLGQAMSPPNFPIGPHGLRGRWSWEEATEGLLDLEGHQVLVREIPHTGGRTLGFRISDGAASFAYLSDHMPQALGAGPDGLGEYHDAALALADGVDVLVHDGQYTAEELPDRGGFGHAAAEYAVALGEKAGADTVVLFHHDPVRTDQEVDAIVARFSDAAVTVIGARQGDCLPL